MRRSIRAGALVLVLGALAHTSHVLVPVYQDVYEVKSSKTDTTLISPAFRLEKYGDVYRVVVDEKMIEPRRELIGYRVETAE